MDCTKFCNEQITKILKNNSKMTELEKKGNKKLYTQAEIDEYKNLLNEGVNLELDRQRCIDGCQERNRTHRDSDSAQTNPVDPALLKELNTLDSDDDTNLGGGGNKRQSRRRRCSIRNKTKQKYSRRRHSQGYKQRQSRKQHRSRRYKKTKPIS
jgi:hypothetical protein